MRIYELAKELGVDNRVVITKAAELGFSNKSSHSNSLDPNEADLIRRAVIRQAIGVSPESETVTTRVDRVTGEKAAIVEKRKGNVIRRRKHSGSEEASDGLDAGASNLGASDSDSAVPDLITKFGADQSPDSLFDNQDNSSQATANEATADQADSRLAAADELFAAAAPARPDLDQLASVDPAGTETTTTASASVEEEVKRGIGPRVLGKISLPQAKVIRPPEKKGPGAAPFRSAPAAAVTEDLAEGRGDKRKTKTKRKEFSRADFINGDPFDTRRVPRRAGGKSRDAHSKKSEGNYQLGSEQPAVKVKRVVRLDDSILVGELAKQLSVKVSEVVGKLMELGILATINQVLDRDTAQIVAEEFGAEVEIVTFDEQEIFGDDTQDESTDLSARPPIVTVMGHVDHGKTSLLDAIRTTSVAAREHGGITQHIGAYTVVLEDGRKVTFIDTPGHEAFTSMRARGAELTDIVVLVVAADDGAMPQTLEAISHAKAAGVSIVVAINKMDRPGANPDRIKQQLSEAGVQPEDWGGDTMFVPVSALKRTGIKELLESILLLADVKELKANANRRARGTIIEARQDRGRGTVATVLVQNGTMKVGDIFISGAESGRVRSMIDADGTKRDEVGPSIAVEITGFSGMPQAGDDFLVVETEAQARQVNQSRREKLSARERILATGPISFEEFAKRANNTESFELNVILKADVHGSIGAIRESLEKISTDRVKVRVLHAGVGSVTESDIQLAIASRAIVIGFGVRADPRTTAEAESAGVELRFYRIIYELLDDVKKAMAGLLPKVKSESGLGRAEVRETFMVPKIGMIAGCYVTDGMIKRGAYARLLRDGKVIFEGRLSSLRRFKDDAKEVQSGFECGVGIDGYNDIKVGDVIEAYEIKETAATL